MDVDQHVLVSVLQVGSMANLVALVVLLILVPVQFARIMDGIQLFVMYLVSIVPLAVQDIDFLRLPLPVDY